MKKKWLVAASFFYLLSSLYTAFGSEKFLESYVEDVKNISHSGQIIKGLFEYNEQQYNEINELIQKKVGYTLQVGNTNFASIRVFYKKQGSDEFEGANLPLSKNVFFVSKNQKVQDEVIFLQQEQPDNIAVQITDMLLDSYARRGNLIYAKIGEGKDTKYKVRVTGSMEKIIPPMNLFKYQASHPFYPDLIHSEQNFLDYYLLGDPHATIISKEKVDCILINIVSRYAACPNCYTALETLLLGKNGIKKEFVSKTFPNTDVNIPIHILYNSVIDSTHRQQIRNNLKIVQQKHLKEIGYENIDLSDGKIHFINTEFGAYLKKQSLINKPQFFQKITIEEEIEDKPSMMILKQEQLSKENIEFLLSLNPDINKAFEKMKQVYTKRKETYKDRDIKEKHSRKKSKSPKSKYSRSRSRDKGSESD